MAQASLTPVFEHGNAGLQVGQNFAPNYVNFHASPERPETPPSVSAILPFERDPDYINRPALTDEIHRKLSFPAARVALVGFGGVGKSQLAIEYSYQLRERSPKSWVLWIHASNAARFEQSVRDIADQLKIFGRQNPNADIYSLFRNWLRNKDKGSWLLILDNVDDASFLLASSSTATDQPGTALVDYVPVCDHGTVLITSRNRDAALKLVDNSKIVSVQPMAEEHATALLRKKLERPQDNQGEIAELASALEHMPLALIQAAAYINRRTPMCSVQEYLTQFKKDDQFKTRLLGDSKQFLRRDREASNSILLTWQITFEHIYATRRSAAELLSVMCFFDNQSIQKSLLLMPQPEARSTYPPKLHESKFRKFQRRMAQKFRRREEPPSSKLPEKDRDWEFGEDVRTLQDYSFISTTPDSLTFEMHKLVQLATRRWLERQDQLERWQDLSLLNLSAVFPSGEYESWVQCRSLFPHAKSALDLKPHSKNASLALARLMASAAFYALGNGLRSEAERMAAFSVKINEKEFGLDGETTLESLHLLGNVIRRNGRLKEAEQIQLLAFEQSNMNLGEHHPLTLRISISLASAYYAQKNYKKAELLLVDKLNLTKKVFGEEGAIALRSMANLANVYFYQGRYGKAEDLKIQLLQTLIHIYGEEYPHTLNVMNNLAMIYSYQKRYREAEDLFLRVIKTKKKVLGEEHPVTLSTIRHLAAMYLRQKRYDEAEEALARVLESSKKILGDEDPDTLRVTRLLAETHLHQGRYDETEEALL